MVDDMERPESESVDDGLGQIISACPASSPSTATWARVWLVADDIPTNTSGDVFVKTYLLDSIVYTQRGKLHLGYLVSRQGPPPSHEKCLASTRGVRHPHRGGARAPPVLLRCGSSTSGRHSEWRVLWLVLFHSETFVSIPIVHKGMG